MQTPRQIVDDLGCDAIAERLRLSVEYVERVRRSAKLPSSWYFALSDMAGCDLPHSAFSFKGLAQ